MLALLALASSVFWGTSDFFAGLKARTIAPPAVVAVTQGFALLALSVILLARHTGFSPSFSGNGPFWAIAAGVAGALGLVCFYTALASGTMGVVAPISSLGALVPVFLGLLTGEHPSVTAWVGMAVAVTGAALASGPELTGAVPPRPVLLAAVAAACFGTALYCLDRGARYSLLETLWGMRATSVVLFLIAGLVAQPCDEEQDDAGRPHTPQCLQQRVARPAVQAVESRPEARRGHSGQQHRARWHSTGEFRPRGQGRARYSHGHPDPGGHARMLPGEQAEEHRDQGSQG